MILALTLLLLQSPNPVQALTTAESTHNAPQAQSALIQLADTLSTATPETTRLAIPPILQAIADPDPQTRTLGMLALIAIPSSNHALLNPSAATIVSHLSDPEPSVRSLTILVLGAFTPNPPDLVLSALRDHFPLDANSDPARSLPIVPALLALDIERHPESAQAILAYLRTLPPATVPRLIATIAHAPHHSAVLDTGLLPYLSAKNPLPVRTALVSVLPTLQITPADLTRTRTELNRLTEDPNEPLALKSVVREILPCWHTPHMSDPCPALPVRYRLAPPPHGLPKPRYQSPPLHKDQSS